MESSSVTTASEIIESQAFTPKSLGQVPKKGKNWVVSQILIICKSCHFLESNRKRSNFKAKQIQSLLSTEIPFHPRIRKETTFTSRKGSTCKTNFFNALISYFSSCMLIVLLRHVPIL